VLASGGHVTQAVLALTPRLGWQAYHWMLERGRFRLLGLIPTALNIDLCPWPGCDGSNALWSVGESDPGITARVDDALI
jgi:hypothetical protein